MSSEKKPKCVKPGCGALRLIGRPCADWDCPQHWVHHSDHEATIEALRAERDEALRERDEFRDDPFTYRKLAEAAEDRVAQLEAALERFASIFDLVERETEGFSEDDELELMYGDHLFERFKLSDFRRARALLSDGGRDDA